MHTARILKAGVGTLLLVVASGCAGVRAVPEPKYMADAPQSWERIENTGSYESNWVADFADTALQAQISSALANNHDLALQAARVEEARQALIASRATRVPSLAAGLGASRRKAAGAGNSFTLNDTFSLGTDAQYELDVWGRLSATQQQAQSLFRAEQYEFENRRLQLVSAVARAWYGAIYAHQLSGLFQQRVENIEQNLDIIERGYKQGINSALDVYLTRSSAEQERARWARQQQVALESVASLQLLLAEYPGGQWSESTTLPTVTVALDTGLPADMVARRPDLQTAWFQMYAQNAAVAVAHRQRFPQLLISASVDDVAGSIGNALDGSGLLWSLAGNVSQTLFAGGRLVAQEEQARQRLIQAEQFWLGQVNLAFAEVENALSERHSLARQLAAVARAEDNASAAYELSFQQYQRGLVSYATVLEAQQRAFDAKSSLLELRFGLLVNRITLNTALGGSGDTSWLK